MTPLFRIRRLLRRLLLKPLMRLLRLEICGNALPATGPAIVVANHNSHLDTAALLAAFPTDSFDRVRPAAAADYFLATRWLRWLSLRIIGVVPVARGGGLNALDGCLEALDRDDILLVFPEGTRGVPGRMEHFRAGVAMLSRLRPAVPVYPVHISGTAEAFPKGCRFPRHRGIRLTVGTPEQIRDPDPATALARLEYRVAELGRAA